MIPSQGESQINSILSIYTRYSKNALNSFKFGDKKKNTLTGGNDHKASLINI